MNDAAPVLGAATLAWAVAVNVTQTITLGSIIIGVLVGLSGLVVFGYGVKWKSIAQVAIAQADELRKGLADERTRADRSEAALADALKLIGELKETVARLEALPNLERLVKFMAETAAHQDEEARERLTEGMGHVETLVQDTVTRHEERAQERHEASIAVLSGLAANMERLVQRGGTP